MGIDYKIIGKQEKIFGGGDFEVERLCNEEQFATSNGL